MLSEPTKLYARHQPTFDFNLVRLIDVRQLDLSIADVFEAGRFAASDLMQDGWKFQFFLFKAIDGFCFAEGVGITDNGRAILTPMTVPGGEKPARGPGRPPKNSE